MSCCNSDAGEYMLQIQSGKPFTSSRFIWLLANGGELVLVWDGEVLECSVVNDKLQGSILLW